MTDLDRLKVKHGPKTVINIDTDNDESAHMLDLEEIIVDVEEEKQVQRINVTEHESVAPADNI